MMRVYKQKRTEGKSLVNKIHLLGVALRKIFASHSQVNGGLMTFVESLLGKIASLVNKIHLLGVALRKIFASHSQVNGGLKIFVESLLGKTAGTLHLACF